MLTHLNEKADYVNLSIPIIDNNKLSYEYSNSPEQLNNIPNFNIGKARIIKNIKNNTFIDNSEKFIR